MRVIVTGSRDCVDRAPIHTALYDLYDLLTEHGSLTIVHGACPSGADLYADEWAGDNWDAGVRVECHPADWDHHGASAGPIRNRAMIAAGIPLRQHWEDK